MRLSHDQQKGRADMRSGRPELAAPIDHWRGHCMHCATARTCAQVQVQLINAQYPYTQATPPNLNGAVPCDTNWHSCSGPPPSVRQAPHPVHQNLPAPKVKGHLLGSSPLYGPSDPKLREHVKLRAREIASTHIHAWGPYNGLDPTC